MHFTPMKFTLYDSYLIFHLNTQRREPQVFLKNSNLIFTKSGTARIIFLIQTTGHFPIKILQWTPISCTIKLVRGYLWSILIS